MEEYFATLKDNITCSLCCELFNHTIRVPKGLPCLHNFCLHCLRSYVKKAREEGKELVCPLCENEFSITKKGSVDDLPTNSTVKNMIDMFPADKEESKVGVCETHGNKQYMFLCSECDTGLCKFCITNLKNGPHVNHALEHCSTAFERLEKWIDESRKLIDKYADQIDQVHTDVKQDITQAKEKQIESVIEKEKEVIAHAQEWRYATVKEIKEENKTRMSNIDTKYDGLTEKINVMRVGLMNSKSLLDEKDFNVFRAYRELKQCEQFTAIKKEIDTNFGTNTHGNDFVSLSIKKSFGKLEPVEFTWYISDVKEFVKCKETQYSPTFFCLDHMCRIVASIREDYLGIFLENSVVSEKSPLRIGFDLIVTSRTRNNFSRNIKEHIFTKKENVWGFENFLSKSEFLNPTNGYVYENCAAISLKIHTK